MGTLDGHADQALQDEALLLMIERELAKRCKKGKTRGRPATTAEIILRMLLLKHLRDWSFEEPTRELRANLVYREFTELAAASARRQDAGPAGAPTWPRGG